MEDKSDFFQIFYENCERNPNSIALRIPGKDFTYSDMCKLIFKFVEKLLAQGVGTNSTVAIWSNSGFVNIIAPLAIGLIGARWITATKIAIQHSDELNITHHIYTNDIIDEKFRNHAISVDESWITIDSGDEIRKTYPTRKDPSAGYFIAQSSGSTGNSKFIELSYGTFTERMLVPVQPDLTSKTTSTLFPTLSYPAFVTVCRTFVLNGTFVAGTDPNFLIACKVHSILGSPAQYSGFFSAYPKPIKKIPCGIFGGAPLSNSFINLAYQYFDEIWNSLGATEAGSIARHKISTQEDDPRCVGQSVDNVTVEICDLNRVTLPVGETGLVRIRSPYAINNYLLKGASDNNVFNDGWFYPGDIGFFNQKSELHIIGRTNDQLNIGGTKIDAARVDNILKNIKGVTDCASFADADLELSVTLAALIEIDPRIEPIAVINEIKALSQTWHFKREIPKIIYFSKSIPRNANGKIVRSHLNRNSIKLEPIKIW